MDRQRALPNISHQVGNNISGGDSGRGGDGGSSGDGNAGSGGGGEGCEEDDVTSLTPTAQCPIPLHHTPRTGQATLATLATAINMVDRQRVLPTISQQVRNNISGGDSGGGGGSSCDGNAGSSGGGGGGGGGEGCEEDDVTSLTPTA